MGTATGLVDARCHPYSRRLVVEPCERDVRPLICERDRYGRADSLLRTGDQRNPACQFHANFSSLRS
jgi:hypothetical protein